MTHPRETEVRREGGVLWGDRGGGWGLGGDGNSCCWVCGCWDHSPQREDTRPRSVRSNKLTISQTEGEEKHNQLPIQNIWPDILYTYTKMHTISHCKEWGPPSKMGTYENSEKIMHQKITDTGLSSQSLQFVVSLVPGEVFLCSFRRFCSITHEVTRPVLRVLKMGERPDSTPGPQ